MRKEKEKDEKKEGEKKTPFIDRWIKSMLLGRKEDGYVQGGRVFLHRVTHKGRDFRDDFTDFFIFFLLFLVFGTCKLFR